MALTDYAQQALIVTMGLLYVTLIIAIERAWRSRRELNA
jgi:hypothetical protein